MCVPPQVLALTGKPPAEVRLLYLGTATYDLPVPMQRQTYLFSEAGCQITELHCANVLPTDLEATFHNVDVVLVSGGNTLYAIDRWTKLGVSSHLREAMQRGVVMCGGSFGAIAWFDAGHSDSADPDSFREPMLAAANRSEQRLQEKTQGVADEASAAPEEGEAAALWQYIRAAGLGFLPGLCCPHYDSTQSNGVLRATDFDGMMLRHPGERGICIDHYAALVVEDGKYRTLGVPDRPGSVLADGSYSAAREGSPGVWRKEVVDGVVQTELVRGEGDLSDLLREATEMVEDPAVVSIRDANREP